MVAIMRSSPGKAKVKFESGEERLSPPPKRTKLPSGLNRDVGIGEVGRPMDEPGPLGLRLKKSPSFLELVRMRLSQEDSPHAKGSASTSSASAAADKLKASNFPASVLRIGTWEYKSRYEGDLVAKCYFAKHKLVWEVLDGALKNKIEMQWSDVVDIKASYGIEGMDTLDVVLARQPLFFRETNPQPRKHTLWQPTSDFTGGQASIYRHHFLQCQQGLLARHFEKLVQCDPRLNFLSQQQNSMIDSQHFEPKDTLFGDHGVNTEKSPFFGSLPEEITSPSGSPCSNLNQTEDFPRAGHDDYMRKAASPSSVMDTRAIEDMDQRGMRRCPPIKVPDVSPSISASNMVIQINNSMSDHATQSIPFPPVTGASGESAVAVGKTRPIRKRHQVTETSQAPTDVKKNSSRQKGQGMRRKDSVGELLLNLPRIASLPQILPGEDDLGNQQNRW